MQTADSARLWAWDHGALLGAHAHLWLPLSFPFLFKAELKGDKLPEALLSPKNLREELCPRVGVRAEVMAMKSRPWTHLARPW